MDVRAAAALRVALSSLPESCPYHGPHLEPRDRLFGREACCDTGVPAMRRRKAEQALAQVLAEAVTTERAAIVEDIRHYFAAVDDPLQEDVRILCDRITRGEYGGSHGAS
ncbi:hypothetical protein [Nonomuraea sp. NPDC049758]|uniref:hypothetical protein n=1 Tax=Nonomuraea sp. NPDC049758 TaxID=3154360 RepID=UPI00341DD260